MTITSHINMCDMPELSYNQCRTMINNMQAGMDEEAAYKAAMKEE